MTDNIDQNEVQKFAAIAEQWWDPTGDFKPLHVINPIRAEYISNKIDLKGKKVLDVGCGGGLLAEALPFCFKKVFQMDFGFRPPRMGKKPLEGLQNSTVANRPSSFAIPPTGS